MLPLRPLITRRLHTKSCLAYADSIQISFPEEGRVSEAVGTDMLQINSQLKQLTKQLKQLTKAGDLRGARNMFDTLPHRDEISWTTMIAGYVNASDSSQALSLFSRMWVAPNTRMDPFILSLALKACGLKVDVKFGEMLHGYSVKSGFVNSVFVGSALLDMYMKNGRDFDGCRLFDEMPLRNVVSWTAIFTGLVRAGYGLRGLSYFAEMWRDGIEYDSYTFAIALKACADLELLKYGREIHARTLKNGVDKTSYVVNSLATMYNKCGKLGYGLHLFENMSKPDVVSWTAIFTGLVRAGYGLRGLSYFAEMWRDGIEYDSYTFAIALKVCADLELLKYGREIHARTLKNGVDKTSYVVNSLATMYNKCGKLGYGLHLFENMSKPDVVSWTSVITSHVQTGNNQQGIRAFSRMRECGMCPDEYTYAAVISGIANIARIGWGLQLHALVVQVGLAASLSVANSLMTMYSKCGQTDSASAVFHEMTRRDIISWSTIIAGHAQGGYGEEVFELLSWMRREGPKPTEFALSSVLSVCGSMAILEQGRQLHAYALTVGLDQTAPIRNALINMYSKCGSLQDAEATFSLSQNDDIVSWTAMINGYADHGYSQEAIDLFEKLTHFGLRPDPVTFIAVLRSCSHVGLLDLGFHYFESMTKEYSMAPSKEHYGCMIDLLCRAGRLGEAENMIKTMPLERDDVVWSTLLRASREHGDVERAKTAAEHLLEQDPDCAGTHIRLANTYASRGKWRQAADVRKLMKSKGVIKEPGWSWITIKDQVSAFVAADNTHPLCRDLYFVLKLIASKDDLTLQELSSILYVSEE